MILYARRQEAQNEEIIRQNSMMINRLSNIESNTNETAYYSKMGAVYSEVNAFFSAASYFEQRKKEK